MTVAKVGKNHYLSLSQSESETSTFHLIVLVNSSDQRAKFPVFRDIGFKGLNPFQSLTIMENSPANW